MKNILDAIDRIPGDKWGIKTITDDSGDSKSYTFDIYATNVYGFGKERNIPMMLGTAGDNADAAIAFAGAKTLAQEVRRLRGILDHHRIPYQPDAPNQEEEP